MTKSGEWGVGSGELTELDFRNCDGVRARRAFVALGQFSDASIATSASLSSGVPEYAASSPALALFCSFTLLFALFCLFFELATDLSTVATLP